MRLRVILIVLSVLLIGGLCAFTHYWINTQPIAVVTHEIKIDTLLPELPSRNKKIIEYIELHGQEISPTYETAVCTEFVIQVLEKFETLSAHERKLIRIITNENLADLVRGDSSIIKGVQTALLHKHKGIEIDSANVLAGDFVQFWTVYGNSAYGHCGIVLESKPGESITVYSSHPITHGYGKQTFGWPDKIYFARLK